MTIRAENDPKFSRRFWIMGIAAIGFAFWCLYDGIIAWPREQERALVWEKDFADKSTEAWITFAEEQGWSTSLPEESKSEEDYRTAIYGQYAMAIVSGLIGLWLLSIPIRARGRWIEASDTGITSSWGESLNYSDIVEVNKRQWRSKGIAKVTYLDNGRKRKFAIDDYKFDRYPTDAILYELEQRIDFEKITNGPPEPPPGEHADESAAAAEETYADDPAAETSPESRS